MTPSKRDTSFGLSFSPCLGGSRGAGLATGICDVREWTILEVLAKVRSSPLPSSPAACVELSVQSAGGELMEGGGGLGEDDLQKHIVFRFAGPNGALGMGACSPQAGRCCF